MRCRSPSNASARRWRAGVAMSGCARCSAATGARGRQWRPTHTSKERSVRPRALDEVPEGGAPAGVEAEAAVAAASATTRRFREAAEARDIESLLATLAEHVVLRSPITDRVTFRGRAQLRELLR